MSQVPNETFPTDQTHGSGDRQCPPKTPRPLHHPRPPSATGVRSKIPTNVHRVMPGAESQGSLDAPQEESYKNSAKKLTSKSFNSTAAKKVSNAPSGMQRRQLENQLHVKKNKYVTLKKELVEKQKSAIEMYEDVVQLREKLLAAGGKDPGKIDAIQLLCDQSLNSPGSGETTFVVDSTVTKEFVSSIQLQLEDLSKNLFDVCKDTLQKYSKVLNRLTSFDRKEPESMLELKEFEVDHENLMTRLEAARKVEDEFRSGVMSKIAILWSEIDACRIRIKHLENAGDGMANQLRSKLNCEVEKLKELKDRKSTVDGQLQKAKLRIKELEGRVEEDETKVSQLQASVKNLEALVKQKDVNAEQRTKELQKLLKNSEAAVAKLESQRDSLESRLIELKNEKPSADSPEVNASVAELTEKIETLENKLQSVEIENQSLQSKLLEAQEHIVKFKDEKSEIESRLKAELNEKANEIALQQQTISALQKEKDALQQKVKELECEPPPSNQNKTGNIIYGSREALELNNDLRNKVAELKHRVENLELELNQYKTQLQQKERLLREQAKQLKMRDEMIAIMNKNDKGMASPGKSGKDLVGKASLDELYSTLEEKQKQIMHLEKVMKKWEEHDRCAQEQRIRLEKRIGQLELNLENKKSENRKRFGIL